MVIEDKNMNSRFLQMSEQLQAQLGGGDTTIEVDNEKLAIIEINKMMRISETNEEKIKSTRNTSTGERWFFFFFV